MIQPVRFHISCPAFPRKAKILRRRFREKHRNLHTGRPEDIPVYSVRLHDKLFSNRVVRYMELVNLKGFKTEHDSLQFFKAWGKEFYLI